MCLYCYYISLRSKRQRGCSHLSKWDTRTNSYVLYKLIFIYLFVCLLHLRRHVGKVLLWPLSCKGSETAGITIQRRPKLKRVVPVPWAVRHNETWSEQVGQAPVKAETVQWGFCTWCNQQWLASQADMQAHASSHLTHTHISWGHLIDIMRTLTLTMKNKCLTLTLTIAITQL